MAKVSDAHALRATLRTNFNAFVCKMFSALAPGQTFMRNWHPRNDRLSAGAASLRRDQAADHQYATALAEVDNGFGRVSGLRPGPRSDSAHHLRVLFGRSGQETRQRLSRGHGRWLVSRALSWNLHRAEGFGERDRTDRPGSRTTAIRTSSAMARTNGSRTPCSLGSTTNGPEPS
jgi:hypothetical protein